MWRRRGLIAVVCAAALAAVAAGDDPAPPAASTTEWASGDGRVSLSVPATWKVARLPLGRAAMALQCGVPGVAAPVAVDVIPLQGMVSVRAEPFVTREAFTPSERVRLSVATFGDPLPHIVYAGEDPAERRVHASIYRVLRRNGFAVRFALPAAAWPKLRNDCMAIAQSLGTKLDLWLPKLEGARTVERDGFAYRVHPAATDAHLDGVHRRLRELASRFSKEAGPFLDPAQSPVAVVLLSKREDAASAEWAASYTRHGPAFVSKLETLFTVPLAKGDTAANAELAHASWFLFTRHAFSSFVPPWFLLGGARAAESEALTGRPLPAVPDAFVAAGRKTLLRLDELTDFEKAKESLDDLFVYYAFLRCGPKPYRDALARFLKDLAATGDALGAERTHILSLDQEKLRADALAWSARGFQTVRR